MDYKLKLIETKRENTWYLNSYCRTGKYVMWYTEYENDTSSINLDFINSTAEGVFTEFGLGIGVKRYFNLNRTFGIDFSANMAKRFDRNDKIVYDTGIYEKLYDVKEQYVLPFLKLNLFYMIKNE